MHLWWGLTALADALAALQPPPGARGAWMRHRRRRLEEGTTMVRRRLPRRPMTERQVTMLHDAGRADSPARAAGFVERRTGKGGHRQLVHPETKRVIPVSVHTSQEVGTGLARRMMKEAGM